VLVAAESVIVGDSNRGQLSKSLRGQICFIEPLLDYPSTRVQPLAYGARSIEFSIATWPPVSLERGCPSVFFSAIVTVRLIKGIWRHVPEVG
jgi:hypothetical protein